MKRLIDDAYKRAKKLIIGHRDKLEMIAKALLEYETLDGAQVKDIIEHGEMRNPPTMRPKPPTSTPPPLPTIRSATRPRFSAGPDRAAGVRHR